MSFDREINLRGIVYAAVGLVAVTAVVHLLIWSLIQGFNRFDTKRDATPSPMAEANRQPPPSGPRLQTTPALDLAAMRQDEDRRLNRAGWIDQQKGTIRVPIDVAMEVVANRGLGPEVVGGTPGGFPAIPNNAQPPVSATSPQERR
jgi:hypothetical protein